MKKTTIITGKIRSGKTTYLRTLISSLKNVGGIIQPTIGDNRFFEDIKSSESMLITSQKENDKTFRLGRFLFNTESFIWAKEKLKLALHEEVQIIVVDEYGPLELTGKGLEPEVSAIIETIKKVNTRRLIIIIRETLVDEFIQKFNLSENEVEIIRIDNQSKVLS